MEYDAEELQALRLERWGQTEETRTPDTISATRLIERVGIATLYPVSPEIPNLLHAYTGTTSTRAVSDWDSASGHIYTWRWELGRQEAAFYTAIVRGRPTLVSWSLLPAVLRLRGELRTPDDLHEAGLLSEPAYRIARVLEEAGGVLGTGELRRAAGFPIGKAQRAAFLRAIAELDSRLLLAKVFSHDDEDMRHALVATRYPDHAAGAVALSRVEALQAFLATYLRNAVYAVPTTLAKHMGLPAQELRAGLDSMVTDGRAAVAMVDGIASACYVWREV